jgi:hypothetical protein
MEPGAPDPCLELRGDDLWIAYRTRPDDHFAVVRFVAVREYSFGDPGDQVLQSHALYSAGFERQSFHEVNDQHLAGSGFRRWVVTFGDETLDVTARGAAIVVRAVQAPGALHVLAALRT